MEKALILLDLGGVVADLGNPTEQMGLPLNEEEFWSVWLSSKAVRDFETGILEFSEFAKRISPQLGCADFERFIGSFGNWKLKLFPGVENLLDALSFRFDIALLSNTNRVHWAQICQSTDLFQRFNKHFLSFETGLYKPERRAFIQVTDHFNCRPEDVFFFDDDYGNVTGALELGMQAEKVVGPMELEDAICRVAAT